MSGDGRDDEKDKVVEEPTTNGVRDDNNRNNAEDLQLAAVPFSINIAQHDLNRFNCLMEQFLNAVKVAQVVNGMVPSNCSNNVKEPESAHLNSSKIKELDIKSDPGCSKKMREPEPGCSKNVREPAPARSSNSKALSININEPGSSKTSDTFIVHGSSSDEKAKPNRGRFFRPFVKADDSSDDDEIDLPSKSKKPPVEAPRKVSAGDFIWDDSFSALSEDFEEGINQGSQKVSKTTKGKEKHQYFLRPPRTSTSYSSMSSSDDDTTPKKRGQKTKQDMLKAVKTFFGSASKDSSGLKCKQQETTPKSERKKKDKPFKSDRKHQTTLSSDEDKRRKKSSSQSDDVDPYLGRCSICLDRKPTALLRCKHLFCDLCCRRLKRAKKPCPKCQKRFRTWEIVWF